MIIFEFFLSRFNFLLKKFKLAGHCDRIQKSGQTFFLGSFIHFKHKAFVLNKV
jgi:hypothetical protein